MLRPPGFLSGRRVAVTFCFLSTPWKTGARNAFRLQVMPLAKKPSICKHAGLIGDMNLRLATIILAMLLGASPALAEWQDATETGPGGKKIPMQRTPGKGAISKSGRDLSATLYLRCDNPYNDHVKYRSSDYWSAFVLFSEPVGSVQAPTRYSFDGGQASESRFMLNQKGTGLFFTQQEDEDNEFIKRLAKSSTLQINPTLTWAGTPTITFDTAGAAAALQQIPCSKKF